MKPPKALRPTPGANSRIHVLEATPSQIKNEEISRRLKNAGLQAAGVAHDLKNLLAVILGYCEELAAQQGLPEPSLGLIMEIANAGNAAKKLAESVLGCSPAQPEIVDLNDSVCRMGPMLARMLGDRVHWEQQLGSGLGTIALQPGQLEQILMNLVLNARDAMPHGGKLCVETANTFLDDAFAREHPGARPGSHVRLSVSDNGCGMDADTQSSLMEPFFTTKPHGQGTGLGLATVAAIVKDCGGYIKLHSRPGAGTRFDLYFPFAAKSVDLPSLATGFSSTLACGTILLVEDSLALRALTRRLLEGAGYVVLDADSSREALTLAQTLAVPIPLLITDIAMPGMSGWELARKLTAFRPETNVLFMSGLCEERKHRMVHPANLRQAYLSKPFTREKLLAAVHDLFETREPGKFAPASVANTLLPQTAPLVVS